LHLVSPQLHLSFEPSLLRFGHQIRHSPADPERVQEWFAVQILSPHPQGVLLIAVPSRLEHSGVHYPTPLITEQLWVAGHRVSPHPQMLELIAVPWMSVHWYVHVP